MGLPGAAGIKMWGDIDVAWRHEDPLVPMGEGQHAIAQEDGRGSGHAEDAGQACRGDARRLLQPRLGEAGCEFLTADEGGDQRLPVGMAELQMPLRLHGVR